MKSKICFITPHVYPQYRGGAEIQVHHLCNELLDRGWDVTYIAESDQKSECGYDRRFRLIFLPKADRNLKFLNYRRLRHILMNERPDVIYVRPVLQYLYVVALLAKTIDAQVIWGCSSDSKLNPAYFLKGFKPLGILNYFMFRKALGMIQHRVVQTQFQQRTLKEEYGASSVIIPNSHPIPTGPFSETRSPIIIWIGRTAEIKNPNGFIELARDLANHHYEFRMIVADSGSKLHQQVLDAASKVDGLTLLTDISNVEVHAELAESALLVNTSHSEGFSNTFIEAWMRGVPVLSLNADPEKLLSSRIGGILCSDLEMMKLQIEELLTDRKKWSTYSSSARKYAIEELSVSIGVNRLESLIKSKVK